MYIVEPETRTYRFESRIEEDQANQFTPLGPMPQKAFAGVPAKDPLDTIIEELREEFKRGFARQAAQKEAMRRKRRVVVTCLLGPGLIVAAAALIGRAIQTHVEPAHHQAHYGH
jgi:hypothetical protein